MTVSAIMKRSPTPLAAVGEDDNLQQVAATLADPDISAVVVLKEGGELAGIITEQDMVHAVAARGTAFPTLKASEVMSPVVVTCTPRDTEMAVMSRMSERHIRHLPVIDKGRVVAVITMAQAVKYRLWKIGQLADEVEQEEDDGKRLDMLSGQLKKLPPEVRPGQIVDVARQVMVAKGMKGFTVRNITREAGLSPGMINLHFGSMEGLLHAVFDSVMFELPDTAGRAPVNLTVAIINLRLIVKRYFEPQYFSRQSLLVWLPLFDAMLRDPEFRKKVYARDENYVAEFASHIAKVMAFRQIEGDAMAIARNLMSFMDGLWLRWCHSSRTDTRAEQAAALDYLESKVGSLQIEGT